MSNVKLYTKKYLTLVFLLMAILSIYIYIVYSNYTNNKELLLDSTRQSQIKLVKAYKSKIDEKLLQKKRIIKATANYIKKKDRIKDYLLIKETLALAIRNGDFRSVYIGYFDDYFITGINWIAPSWYKVTKRQWYKQVENTKSIVVTKPYLDSDLDSNVISIATPLFKDDKLYAVLSSDIKIDDFRHDILSLMPLKEGFAFMMTKSGDVVLRPKKFSFNIDEQFLKSISKEFSINDSGVKTYKIEDENYIFTYDSLENSDWVFITVLSEKKIFEKIDSSLFRNLLIAAILMSIGIIAALYLSNIQRKLLRNKNLLELFAKSSSWGVLMTDKEGKVVFVNKFYEKIFSLANKSLYEKNILEIPHKIGNTYYFENDTHFFTQAKNNPIKISTYKVGNENIFNFQVTPLLKANRYFEGIIVTVNDITNERLIEKNKQKQEKIFIQNSKMIALGEMVSAISHQWKQPLSSLLLLLNNIDEKIQEKDFEDINEYILRSRKNIELMSETMDAFRSFYKEQIEVKEFDLVQIINEIINISSALIKMNSISINFYYNSSYEYKVHGYPTYLKQVLINLISNSKDALVEKINSSDFDEAKISIYLEKHDYNIILRFQDNANGVDSSKVSDIFTSAYTTKGEKGTGTGLHLCKLLIEEKMQGKIFLESNKNPTSFVIELKESK